MKSIVCLPFLIAGACATADPDPTSVDESTVGSNCGFIPGCLDLRDASDGPFIASVMTYEDAAGDVRRRLAVTYREPVGSSFLLCSQFPNQPPVTLVFVLGTTALDRPMRVDCPSAWGDNGGHPDTAVFSIVDDEEPALWDTLFPPGPDGARWYALQVATTNAHGAWDSRYGANYRLVLEPR